MTLQQISLDNIACINQSTHNNSNKYEQISTRAIAEFIQKNSDLVPCSYQQARVKNAKQGYQSHLIKFTNKSFLDNPTVGDYIPQVLLYNSHDGSKSFKLSIGIYRFACLNGLVVGNPLYTVRVRHVNVNWDNITGFLSSLPMFCNQINAKVKRMQAILLDDTKQLQLAQAALNVRIPDVYNQLPDINREAIAVRVLRQRRYADNNSDLFTVFNRVQENCIRGMHKYWYNDNDGISRGVSMRRMTGIDSTIDFNKSLWTIAEGFMQ